MNEHDFDDGLRQLLVCTYGEDCAAKTKQKHGHAMAIYDALKAARNEAGLKRQLYVIRTSCQGWCEYAPVCQVLPEGKIYRNIDPSEAAKVVAEFAKGEDSLLAGRKIWDFSQSKAKNLENKGKNQGAGA